MTDLILYIVKQLVTNPDAVTVEEHNENGEVNLLLTVDPADMGLIIGKGGQTIKSIRKILIVKAMADNVRVNLQLAEPEGGRPSSAETTEDKPERSEQSEKSDVSEKSEDTAESEIPVEEKPAKVKKSKKAAVKETKTVEETEPVEAETPEDKNLDETEETAEVQNPTPEESSDTEEETTP